MYGSKESLGLLKEAMGIASARDGLACGGLTYDFSKFVAGVNMEKVVGGLRSQGISTRGLLRVTGSVKSVKLPSLEEANPSGKTVGCGDVLTASSTTPLGKPYGGTRLTAVPNGNKLEDWIIRSGEPKCATEKHMVPVQRSQGCRSQMRDYSSRCGLRYDPALCESTGVY